MPLQSCDSKKSCSNGYSKNSECLSYTTDNTDNTSIKHTCGKPNPHRNYNKHSKKYPSKKKCYPILSDKINCKKEGKPRYLVLPKGPQGPRGSPGTDISSIPIDFRGCSGTIYFQEYRCSRKFYYYLHKNGCTLHYYDSKCWSLIDTCQYPIYFFDEENCQIYVLSEKNCWKLDRCEGDIIIDELTCDMYKLVCGQWKFILNFRGRPGYCPILEGCFEPEGGYQVVNVKINQNPGNVSILMELKGEGVETKERTTLGVISKVCFPCGLTPGSVFSLEGLNYQGLLTKEGQVVIVRSGDDAPLGNVYLSFQYPI